MIGKLLVLASNGDAATLFLLSLVLIGVIGGLAAALLVYYMDRSQERKRNCAWCHNGSTLGGICFKHARMRRLSTRRKTLRKQKAKQEQRTGKQLVA